MNRELRLIAAAIWLVCLVWTLLTSVQYRIVLKSGDLRGIVPNWILASVLLLPVLSAYIGIRFALMCKSGGHGIKLRLPPIIVSFIPIIGVFVFPMVLYLLAAFL